MIHAANLMDARTIGVQWRESSFLNNPLTTVDYSKAAWIIMDVSMSCPLPIHAVYT
jgi:hypothetical protein